MKNPTNGYNNLTNKKIEKHHTPFSLRLSFDERDLLVHDMVQEIMTRTHVAMLQLQAETKEEN